MSRISRAIWHHGPRPGARLLILPLMAGVAVPVVLVVQLSIRLTNPHGYSHPGPAASLSQASPDIGTDPGSDFGLRFHSVTFPSTDRALLRGWLVPGASGARVGVVTAHGRGADRRDFLRHLPMFHDLGVPTLLFDYREHGVSDGSGRGMSMGHREAEDISAAVRYMKETVGLDKVVVVGVSLGGSSAILAAAGDRSIDAVVAESPFARIETFLYEDVTRMVAHRPVLRDILRPRWWPGLVVQMSAWRQGVGQVMAPWDVVDRIAPRPLLLIHGTGDGAVDWTHSDALYSKAGDPKALWLADGAGHTQVFDQYPDPYRARLAGVIRSIAP